MNKRLMGRLMGYGARLLCAYGAASLAGGLFMEYDDFADNANGYAIALGAALIVLTLPTIIIATKRAIRVDT